MLSLLSTLIVVSNFLKERIGSFSIVLMHESEIYFCRNWNDERAFHARLVGAGHDNETFWSAVKSQSFTDFVPRNELESVFIQYGFFGRWCISREYIETNHTSNEISSNWFLPYFIRSTQRNLDLYFLVGIQIHLKQVLRVCWPSAFVFIFTEKLFIIKMATTCDFVVLRVPLSV